MATNPAGDDETSEATLIVISKPVILIQPTDVSVNSGDTATFTVWADGKALSILWQYRTSPSAKWKDTSAKTNTYSFTAKTSQNGYQYRARVKNAYGTEYTDVVDLKVTLVAPTIPSYGQPANLEVNLGAKATFEVEATSTDLSYAWEYYDTATSTWVVMKDKSAKKAKLTIKKTTAAQNGREYRCVVWNSEGVVTSDAATLTLVTYPVIVTEPSDVEIFAAQTAKFTVKAKGPKLKYQWYYYDDVTSSWKKVSKATKATLTLKKVKLSKDGTKYKCFIKNSYGSVWSKEVNLKVK